MAILCIITNNTNQKEGIKIDCVYMKGIDNMTNIMNKEDNNLTVFQHEEFGEVRTLTENEKTLFCATDVAKALGYSNPRDAISRHCPSVVKRDAWVQTSSKADGEPAMRKTEMSFIPEGDVYRLIVHSKLPSAVKFERWVFDEVLPSIREHGAYLTPDTMAKVMQDPDFIIQLVQTIKEQQIENKALKGEISEMKPKVDFANAVLSSDGSIGVGAFAKLLRQNGVEIGQKRLFEWLRQNDYLISNKGREWNNPTQYSVEHGWIEGHESVIHIKDTTVIKITPLITPAGQQYFAKKLQDYKKS